MQIKKSPKADLNNKKGLFLEIGMIFALLLTVAAFAYTQKERNVEIIETSMEVVEEEITDITTQDQKPPEPPKKVEMQVLSDVLNVVTNDTKIETEFDFSEFSEDIEIVQQIEVVEEAAEDDAPFIIAEEMPKFQGGDLMKFRSWVQGKLKYPQIAQENGISGKVTLTFVIERDGSLTNIQVMQSPDRSLADEAVRVLQSSPKWTPGKQRNSPVRVRYTLPVEFRIQ
ncbi:MAG: energy transducer TonB [Rikenellaceae bacterium]|jgi:protein TonB|nr:energy transducer TonB [Alistipes sp.]MBQ1989588.1 energy transducer TonB [Rikenellaceae bacterium]MBQ2020670.1 energy transducer TonB [Rikenellaceae bacterium]MBQ5372907.1 energy transducer TonB [Rikenellaceae bacterium]MBQ5595646.1 energy transducer TonB [Rikenellaceae bacterium]